MSHRKDEYDPLLVAGLLAKNWVGALNEGEKKLLEEWVASSPRHWRLFQKLTDPVYFSQRMREWDKGDPDAAWDGLLGRHPELGPSE